MKRLLSQEESMVPSLFSNFRRALLPLMHQDMYSTMARITHEIEANGRGGKGGGEGRRGERGGEKKRGGGRGEEDEEGEEGREEF